MKSNTFLEAVEAGVQIATSPSRNQGAYYKDDTIKSAIGKDIVFKSYCNTHFCQLRRLAGLTESQFSDSMRILHTLNSDSKSGQQFWKSENGLVVLKTMVILLCLFLLYIIFVSTCMLALGHRLL
jgi:hypothetical protein